MILAGQVKADQQLYISDSYYNLNSSEFMELCNISNPTRDGEEVQEARDRVGAQHLTFAILAALIGFRVVNVLLLGYQLAGSRGTRFCICTSSSNLITRTAAGIVIV